MRITIDNLDGKGAVDYSAAVSADAPITIERSLNASSRCTAALMLAGTKLPPPIRRARVSVTSDVATTLFTGYIATDPVVVYEGAGIAGPVCRVEIAALSDEWLLDRQTATVAAEGYAIEGGTLLASLAERTAAGLLSTCGIASTTQVGVFTPPAAQAFSTQAGTIANTTAASYRAVGGALTLQPVGRVTHTLSLGDGTLHPAALRTTSARELANDVTVTGELEPSAYVTELFQGDGTTAVFTTSRLPFRPTKPMLLRDPFDGPQLNPAVWQITDPGAYIALGTGGLVLSGGNGYDGQTTLAAANQFEVGGTLVHEAANVQLTAPSDGVLLGLYDGTISRANCFAGYNVRQSNGATLLTPFLNGKEVGTSYTLLSGHSYTLRIRLHSPEMQRVRQVYYVRVDGATQSFGGGLIGSPVQVVFDLIDVGTASNTPATVLYDSAAADNIATSPAACTFAVVNSLELTGSIGSAAVTQTGSTWITSTPASGQPFTRLSGIAGEGVDCQLSSTGMITFFNGRIPAPGETIAVRYRTRTRAVARIDDPASIAAESAGGFPGRARWLGRVVQPQARSTEDCEAAAQAVLAIASDRSAALSGTYTWVNPQADVWPGDVLALEDAAGQPISAIVRTVRVTDGHALPELVTYSIAFANDWAESLGIHLSEAVAEDALLPATASSGPAPALANLQSLAITSATTTALQVDAGIDPPAGGGFEVRRSDWSFSQTNPSGLVLRSPVRNFAIPRGAFEERFYVRMYDASTPAVYSRLSAEIITHLPTA